MKKFLQGVAYWIQWHEIHKPAAVYRALFVGALLLAAVIA